MINVTTSDNRNSLSIFDDKKFSSDLKSIRKSIKKIQSTIKGDPSSSISGLNTFIISLKNNLKIKKGLLNLNKEEPKENLEAFNDIFVKFPKLKQNVLEKLMRNFNQILNRIEEITNNINSELQRIEKLMINSSDVRRSLEILLETNNENIYYNLQNTNHAYFLELIKIDEEIKYITNCSNNCKKILLNSEDYFQPNSKILNKCLKEILSILID